MCASPEFSRNPGQMDYTHARYVPVINCVIKNNDKILLVQRSEKMQYYPNYWNGISGFLDDNQSLEEKVREEIREEIGLSDEHILSINQVGLFEYEEVQYNKVWITHPVLVEVNSGHIKTDWEAQDYKWVTLDAAKTFNILPGFEKVLELVEYYLV